MADLSFTLEECQILRAALNLSANHFVDCMHASLDSDGRIFFSHQLISTESLYKRIDDFLGQEN